MQKKIILILAAILRIAVVESTEDCDPSTHFGPPKEDQIYSFSNPSAEILSSINADSRETCLSSCCNTVNCNIVSYNHSTSASDDENCFLYFCHPLPDCTFQYAFKVVSVVLHSDNVIISETIPIEVDTTDGPPLDQEIISERIVDVINDTDVDVSAFNNQTTSSLKSTLLSNNSSPLSSTKTSLVPTSASSNAKSTEHQIKTKTTKVQHIPSKTINSIPKVNENNTIATISGTQVKSTSKTYVLQKESSNLANFSQTPNTMSSLHPVVSTKSATHSSAKSQSTVLNTGSTIKVVQQVPKPVLQNITVSKTLLTTHNTRISKVTTANNHVDQISQNEQIMTTKPGIRNTTAANYSTRPTTNSPLTPGQNISNTVQTSILNETIEIRKQLNDFINIKNNTSTTTTTNPHETTTFIETTENHQSKQTTTQQHSRTTVSYIVTESGMLTTNETTREPVISGDFNVTFADSNQLLEEEKESHVLSAALISALSFGILFFFAVLVLIGKRCFDSWQRRHYSRIDYLVNGMYN